MIQAEVFFHQSGKELIELSGIPNTGDYIKDSGDNVHRVASVLWQHDGSVQVFAIPITRDRANELQSGWETWGEGMDIAQDNGQAPDDTQTIARCNW